jgi:hypothetical protein
MQVVLKKSLVGSELSTANLKLKEKESTFCAAISMEISRGIMPPCPSRLAALSITQQRNTKTNSWKYPFRPSLYSNTAWYRNFIDKLVTKLPGFMRPESSLPCSQKHVIRPYPEPVQSIPSLIPYLPKTHLNIILHSAPMFPKESLRFRFTAWKYG